MVEKTEGQALTGRPGRPEKTTGRQSRLRKINDRAGRLHRCTACHRQARPTCCRPVSCSGLNHRIIEWDCNAKIDRIVAGENELGTHTNQFSCSADVIFDQENNDLIIPDYGNRWVDR